MTAACPGCVAIPPRGEPAEKALGRVTISVPDVHCPACIQSIENGLMSMDGVADARVNLTLRRVQVETDLSPDTLVNKLRSLGQVAYPFDPDLLKAQADTKGHDLILRLGVAGFAMMNVMLLSVAVWAGAEGATRDLFHLLSAAIALPAALYAAQPFFRSAWSALRVARLNMDVPISLAIVLAGGMSLFEALNGGHHAYFDAALSLTFFLLIGRVLDHRARNAARSAAKDLAAMEAQNALRKHGARIEPIPASEIAVNDVLFVPSGMRIPVDGTLLSNRAYCDRSVLTGESDAVTYRVGEPLKAGEVNLGAPIEMRADVVGENTELRKLAALVETAENARNSYTSLADRAARIYAPAVHLLAAIAFVGWWTATGDLRHAINVAVAVLIITCPCALGLAVPAVSTAAIGKLFELGFLVKSGTALERLSEIDTLVFDKTGTLTRPGFDLDALGLTPEQLPVAKALAQASAHPLAVALDRSLAGVEPAEIEQVKEVPNQGVEARWSGRRVRLGHSAWIGSEKPGLALQIDKDCIDLPHKETVLAGAEAATKGCTQLGIYQVILSGDTERKTRRLADRLGIAQWQSGMSPASKHAKLRDLSQESPVAMIGDGINDAAALSEAHASIAPGTALDAARNAADVVLVKENLDAIPNLIRISRKAARLSRQNFAIAAIYNCIAVPVALAGLATPLLAALAMSVSSITVVLNALRVRSVS